MSVASRLLLCGSMHVYGRRIWGPLDAAAEQPRDAQRATLASILAANRDTAFGREHGFASIASPQEYGRRVPVQHYESLRPYVERQRETGETALTSECPVFYAQTSGTTGAPKYIPITAAVLALTRTQQKLFSYLQHRACPEAFAGRTFAIMGAAVEGRLPSGHVVGSVSGHLYRAMPRLLQARFVVPPEVSAVTDYELKYLLMLRLALEVPDITYMGTPNPSSFLRMAGLLETQRAALTSSLASGSFDGLHGVDAEVRDAVAGRITPQPARAAALDRLQALTFAGVWPRIALVTTWTGGSCGIALGALRTLLPDSTRVMELGYQSTECRGTLALDAETPGGLAPLLHTHFEFVEESTWEALRPEFLALDELQPGRRYHVIVTTVGGLYRYFMNDLVEVCGSHRRTPLLRFVQKGRGVTSLTGEKLHEAQVIDAVQHASREHGLRPSFFLAVAEEQAGAYVLYVECGPGPQPAAREAAGHAFAEAVDAQLSAHNMEYEAKRASGRLGSLRVVWLRPGAAEAYKLACMRDGQREGQYKPTVLLLACDLRLSRAELDALTLPC